MSEAVRPRWRRAWITGASTGIGRALALQLVKEGTTVYASARSFDTLGELADAARGLPGDLQIRMLDVTRAEDVTETWHRIEREGPVELVIFNAGTYLPNAPGEISLHDAGKLVDINLTGVLNGLSCCLTSMRVRNSGRIAIISSLTAWRGLPRASVYGATKAALVNLAEALAIELADTQIRISVATPGFVETPLTARNDFPMPFMVTAEDAARRILEGVERRRFTISFPRRLSWPMALCRLLPHAAYSALIRAITGRRTRV